MLAAAEDVSNALVRRGAAGISTALHANPLPHRLYRPDRVRAGRAAAAVLCRALRRLAAADDAVVRHLLADGDDRGAAVGPAQRPGRPPAGADGEHGRFGGRLSLPRDGRQLVAGFPGAGLCRGLRRQHRGRAGLRRRRQPAGSAGQGDGHDRRRLRSRLYRRAGDRRAGRRRRSGDGGPAYPRFDRRRMSLAALLGVVLLLRESLAPGRAFRSRGRIAAVRDALATPVLAGCWRSSFW